MNKSTLVRLEKHREHLAEKLSPSDAERVQGDFGVLTTKLCDRDRAIANELKQTLRDMAAVMATAA